MAASDESYRGADHRTQLDYALGGTQVRSTVVALFQDQHKFLRAYGSYFAFFLAQVKKYGVTDAFHKYIMAPEANADGALMFARFFGGA
jgi:hypothetical protein